jgi:hypothetical protein
VTTYVIAKSDIPVGGVLAYTRGQKVDAEAVKANGWEDYVVGENTKEARAIIAEITGQSEPEPDKTPTVSRPAASSTTREG